MMNKQKIIMNNEELISGRDDFPLLVGLPNIVYLDNAATAQKPHAVIKAEKEFYEKYNANPLRGMYELSAQATAKYETARATVAQYINAEKQETIFTSGATISFNMLALMLEQYWQKEKGNGEIIVSVLEHHANLLPWQNLAKRLNWKLQYLEPDENGTLQLPDLDFLINERTKIVALTGMSNVTGMKANIGELATRAHKNGAFFVCDAAQLIAHDKVDVKALNVDALAFSGHKIMGPMGTGVLYLKKEWGDKLQPIVVGGEMIDTVTRDNYTLAPLPYRFEAGTVNAAGAVGLAAAIDYIDKIGMDRIIAREQCLTEYLMNKLQEVDKLQILGSKKVRDHQGVVSFNIQGVHAHDVAAILASDNICVRAGHHCAAVLHQYYGIPASVRISLAWYNTREEIDKAITSLQSVRRRMGYDK